jgi:hypothetical protein
MNPGPPDNDPAADWERRLADSLPARRGTPEQQAAAMDYRYNRAARKAREAAALKSSAAWHEARRLERLKILEGNQP